MSAMMQGLHSGPSGNWIRCTRCNSTLDISSDPHHEADTLFMEGDGLGCPFCGVGAREWTR
jgi:hypothetical protein